MIGSSKRMTDRFGLPARLGTGERSVWVEYSLLAAEYEPVVNLGLGFPDYHAPENIRMSLSEIAIGPDPLLNQYARRYGHSSLVKSLSKLYSRHLNRELDPMNEIIVTTGASEALYLAILGFIDRGDEVILIEPYFDCYNYLVKMVGGVPRFIALKLRPDAGIDVTSGDWVLDEAELTSLFNSKTKMLILNTPHNPTGKVFTQQELELIAKLCKKHNVLCLSDEVYEWMVYKPHRHIRIATLPGMWERTVTIGSAGKTFFVTGWRIGWAYGSANLMTNLRVIHQNTCCTPVQEAVSRAIEYEIARIDSPDCLFVSLACELEAKRDKLMATLKSNGFKPTLPNGGYFIVADWTKLENKIDLTSEPDRYKDYKFTKKFTKEAGVIAIPLTAFYAEQHKTLGENYARFCFTKRDEILDLTDELMKTWNAKK